MNSFPRIRKVSSAFTLIELLVVITIIGVLAGLLLPVISSVQNSARVTQAKQSEQQLVGGVKAFILDYGRMPVRPANLQADQYTYGENDDKSAVLMSILKGDLSGANGETGDTVTLVQTLNPKLVTYLEWPMAKNATEPKNGLGPKDGQPYDPWGKCYNIRVDSDSNGSIPNPYAADSGAGPDPLLFPVLVWSFGADKQNGGTNGARKDATIAKDDVISWQQ